LAVLLYIVWIVDLIPDFIFFIALVDDVTSIAWFLSSINQKLEKFREWEVEQNSAINSRSLQNALVRNLFSIT
jgi:uncharacterized membrane protein YkvA (DUF1232 family)